MNIHFLGLSGFMIENAKGFRVLVDPYSDASEWSLGVSLPTTFQGKPFGTNIILLSEPDADHASVHGDWLQHAPPTKPNSDPFPGFSVRGTIVYEWNGDINIAWSYTIDGVRLLHLADNAHVLTSEQVAEMRRPDILFISPPKTDPSLAEPLESVRKNISLLQPKLIIWTHHIVPEGVPLQEGSTVIRAFFVKYFRKHASTNKHFKDESSFIELVYILENALTLQKEYHGTEMYSPTLTIDKSTIDEMKNQESRLFTSMLGIPFQRQ